MNLLPREIEERYGAARGLIIPALVTQSQLEILRAEEKKTDQVWHIPALIYAGSRIVCIVQPSTGYIRPLQFNLPTEILDLEDFDNFIKDTALTEYGLEVELGHYLLMAQVTFMSDSSGGSEDGGTSSRTLHLFTGHVRNLEEFISETVASQNHTLRLCKPTELNALLEAEWNEIKAQRLAVSPSPKPALLTEYNNAWVFVYARLVAQAFHQLFGWELPPV